MLIDFIVSDLELELMLFVISFKILGGRRADIVAQTASFDGHVDTHSELFAGQGLRYFGSIGPLLISGLDEGRYRLAFMKLL